ncbi:protein kinase family protein [archaeon]|nr:MAG: protein kinase family protein [archaeon]
MGGYIASEHASLVRSDRDMIRIHFDAYAKPVAIKHYFEREDHINTTSSALSSTLPQSLDYIAHSLGSFDVGGVELYGVQEMGIASLDKALTQASLAEQLKMIRGVCLAVQGLHNNADGAILHGDICLSNFILIDNGCIKICDKSTSCTLPAASAHQTSLLLQSQASLSHQPYELQIQAQRVVDKQEKVGKIGGDSAIPDVQFAPISTSTDIFMLGLTIYKIVTALDAMTSSDILHRRTPNLSAVIKRFAGGEMLAHLVSTMLSHDATKRPPINDVLDHPFFRSWKENASCIQGLYHELHGADGVQYTESVRVLEVILQPLEQQVNWKLFLRNLPAAVIKSIGVSNDPPLVRLPDGVGTKPHPLPNLHGAIQFLHNFFVHFEDHNTLSKIFPDLRAKLLNKHEAAGEFVYAHSSLSWVLPKLWETKVYYLQHLHHEEQVWAKEWATMQKKNEEVRIALEMREKKIESLLGNMWLS